MQTFESTHLFWIVHIFLSVKCCECCTVSTKVEAFNELPVPIGSNPTDLNDAIGVFFTREDILEKGNAYECGACTNTNGTRTYGTYFQQNSDSTGFGLVFAENNIEVALVERGSCGGPCYKGDDDNFEML